MPADVRSPFVIDTRELDRRAGSEKRVALSVPAPVGLAIPDIGIPAGAPVRLRLSVDSVVEGFWVSGTVSGDADGECVRCLDPVHLAVDAPVEALYVYAERSGAPGEIPEDAEDAEEVFALEGDLLDLEQAVRDAVVLELPLLPLCREDCPGLLPDGTKATDAAPAPVPTDLRWAALAGLTERSGR